MKYINLFGDSACLYGYKISRLVHNKLNKKLGFFIARINQVVFGCFISPKAILGNIKIVHPIGLVIGNNTTIEDDCILSHNIVFGDLGDKKGIIVEKGCRINTNSVIFGKLRIGKNCIIGAGSYIDCDVPDNSIVHPKKELNININNNNI